MYSMAMVLVSLSTVNKGGDTFSKGVLAQSPFGKSLGIRILDAHTLKTLKHGKKSDFPLLFCSDFGRADPQGWWNKSRSIISVKNPIPR